MVELKWEVTGKSIISVFNVEMKELLRYKVVISKSF